MENGKKFNPNFGHGYADDKFGQGAIKIKITQEGLDALMKSLQVDGSLVIRPNKVTKYGAMHYFTEILPPMKPGFKKSLNTPKKFTKPLPTDDLD